MTEMLYRQLFLLGFDPRKGRMDLDNHWQFGLALRAAMLTDLYHGGYLRDADDRPCPTGAGGPSDRLLDSLLDEVVRFHRRDWVRTIMQGQRATAHDVRVELGSSGRLQRHRKRVLGVFPATRYVIDDQELVTELAADIGARLRAAMDGQPSGGRELDLGLLAVTGRFPGVLADEEINPNREVLDSLIEQAAPPVAGLRTAIQVVELEMARLRSEADSHVT